MTPLRIFIGFDPRETAAYHVLCHSILARATAPVAITPVARPHLKTEFRRPRGGSESTEFSISRFLVPYLSGYAGISVWMDCDMLCLVDIWDLVAEISRQPGKAVWVVKHDYVPATERKFFGQEQTRYERKNWSSLVVFRNDRCQALTPEFVSVASGLELHRFHWLDDAEIGELDKAWNHLVGEYAWRHDPKVIHWTLGGPWLKGYEEADYAGFWCMERDAMLACG